MDARRIVPYIIAFFSVFCATTTLLGEDFNYKVFDKSSGLKGLYIYDVNQDARGYLWMGTGKGLTRYDGKSIKHFTIKDGLADDFVTSSINAKSGHVYFGHFNGGITVYNGRKFVAMDSGLIRSKIIQFAEDVNGNIWLATQNKGIYRIYDDTVRSFPFPILKDKIVNCFNIQGNEVLVGTNEGLSTFSIKNDSLFYQGEVSELEYVSILSVSERFHSDGFWIGTEDQGLYELKYEENNWTAKQQFAGEKLESYFIQNIIEDQFNTLWLGTKNRGVISLQHKGDKIIRDIKLNHANGFLYDHVSSMHLDREGGIWVGTFGKGIVQVTNTNFTFYDFLKSDSIKRVNCAVTSKTEPVFYIGTEQGVLKLTYDARTSNVEIAKNGFDDTRDKEIISILHASNRDLWIGSEKKGLFVLNPDTAFFKQIILEGMNGLETIRTIVEDGKGDIWFAVSGKGMYRIKKTGEVYHYFSENGFIHNEVYDIFPDSKGRIWFATHTTGLGYYKEGEGFNYLTKDDKFPARNVNSIREDKQGNLWIATDGSGAFRLNDEGYSNYIFDDGLISNYCSFIIIDKNDDIWTGHRGGVCRIDSENEKITPFTYQDGLNPLQEGRNLAFIGSLGSIWVSSEDGASKYNYPEEQFVGVRLESFITELSINNIPYKLKDKDLNFISLNNIPEGISLEHDENNFTFNFITVSLKKKDGIYYRYRLEGYDKDWSIPTVQNSARFTNMDPGKYAILIASSGDPDNWTNEYLRYEFEILLPYWSTWWFYLTQMMVIVGLFFVTYELSIYSADKKKNQWILKLMVYVVLFILFEYIQTFLEPFTSPYIGGAPVFRIMINLILALVLFPVEGLVRKYFYSKSDSKAAELEIEE